MFNKYPKVKMFFFSGNTAVTPYEFARLELTPEVPVIDEPSTVTCTANIPDVQTITVHQNDPFLGCHFNILNNKKSCHGNGVHNIIVSICLTNRVSCSLNLVHNKFILFISLYL